MKKRNIIEEMLTADEWKNILNKQTEPFNAPDRSKQNLDNGDPEEELKMIQHGDIGSADITSTTPETAVVSYKELERAIYLGYRSHQIPMIWGPPGLGKTDIVESTAKEIANLVPCGSYTDEITKIYQTRASQPSKEIKPIEFRKVKESTDVDCKRKFVNWNRLNEEQRRVVASDLNHYFIFSDVSMAHTNPDEFAGIYNLASKSEWNDLKVHDWLWPFIQQDNPGIPNSGPRGILFFDEITAVAYQQALYPLLTLLQGKKAGTKSLNENIMMVMAGNWGSQSGSGIELPPAIKNRVAHYVLKIDFEGWAYWARKNKIWPYIIDFIKIDPSQRFYPNATKGEGGTFEVGETTVGYPSPRAFHKLSDEIKEIIKMYTSETKTSFTPDDPKTIKKQVYQTAQARCGISWAREFIRYLDEINVFKYEDYLSGKKKIDPKLRSDQISSLKESFVTNFVEQIQKLIVDYKHTGEKIQPVLTDEFKGWLSQWLTAATQFSPEEFGNLMHVVKTRLDSVQTAAKDATTKRNISHFRKTIWIYIQQNIVNIVKSTLGEDAARYLQIFNSLSFQPATPATK